MVTIDIVLISVGCIITLYSIINPKISFIKDNVNVYANEMDTSKKLLSLTFSMLLIGLGIFVYYNPVKMAEEKLFSNPLYRDYRLDNCLYDEGKSCGLEAAIKWCRAQGFKTAVDFNVQNISKIGMQTKRFGDDFVCTRGDICAGFTFIQCSK